MDNRERKRQERGTSALAVDLGTNTHKLRELADAFDRADWMADAACRGLDPALFFPRRWDDDYRDARAVCRDCPVTFEYADHGARISPRDGMWGGMTPKQLWKWRRTRGLGGGDREKRCGKVSTCGNGCRCDECRAAKAAYEREYRKRGAS